MSMPAPLDQVLLRPDVWRGDRFAPNEAGEISSGFALLDAELPGGGWPRGALTELLPARRGIGELALLQPALRQCAEAAPVALVAPPLVPHAPAWAAVLPLERLLLVEASGREAAWAAEALLGSGALGALLVWLPAQLDVRSLRRLQLAAEGHAAPVFVFRPPAMAHSASPAPLRLVLSAVAQGLQVELLKRRGPPCPRPLRLDLARPVASRPAVQRAPFQPQQPQAEQVWV